MNTLTDNPGPTTPPTRPLRRGTTLAAAVLVGAAAFAFGWPTRHGDFLAGDDERFVVEHYLVNHPSPDHAAELLLGIHDDLYQPLPMLSFQINYAIAGREPTGPRPVSPFGFHLTNILLHCVNAMLAFLLASRLAGFSPGHPDRVQGCRRIGLLVGLMFACHPFALEAVAWINGRMILMATTFALLALWFSAREVKGASSIGALMAWAFGLLCKIVPTIPLAAACCDRHVHRRLSVGRVGLYVFMLGAGCVGFWWAGSLTTDYLPAGAVENEQLAPAPTRILLATGYYLENYVWPRGLAPWSPPVTPAMSLLDGPSVIAMLEIAAMFILAVLAWRHDRTALLGLGLFILLLAPFIAATGARRLLAADRYMYLPIFGLHLAAASVVVRGLDSLRARMPAWVCVPAVGVPCVIMLAAWAMIGRELASAYADTVRRDQRVAEVYPDSPDAQAELARAYNHVRDADAALAVVGRARERWSENPRLAAQAGAAHIIRKDWRSAVAELRAAAGQMPDHKRTLYLLAFALEESGETQEAERRYIDLASRDPGHVPALLGLARICENAGRFSESLPRYRSALEINPHQRDALLGRARILLKQGAWEEAANGLRLVLEDNPDDAEALLLLGVAEVRRGRMVEALTVYDRLLLLDPTATAARLNRAEVLKSLGRLDEAEEEYRTVLARQPDQKDAKVGLREVEDLRARRQKS